MANEDMVRLRMTGILDSRGWRWKQLTCQCQLECMGHRAATRSAQGYAKDTGSYGSIGFHRCLGWMMPHDVKIAVWRDVHARRPCTRRQRAGQTRWWTWVAVRTRVWFLGSIGFGMKYPSLCVEGGDFAKDPEPRNTRYPEEMASARAE